MGRRWVSVRKVHSSWAAEGLLSYMCKKGVLTRSLIFNGCRETKVVVKGESTQALMDIEAAAVSKGVPTFLVTDAGRTQVIMFPNFLATA